jgi:4-aminobutyrate aminotransferase/4-aminobutyrate aminotransferase/(S)-3-amino-2-methylpropionate transaminase
MGKPEACFRFSGATSREGLGPFAPGYYSAPYAYCYRCPLHLTYPDCGIACAEETRRVVKEQTSGAVAAILVEPCRARLAT